MLTNNVKTNDARRAEARRAFSLIELIAVVAIVGVIGAMAAMRFGDAAYQTTNAEGAVRRLALDLNRARRATIATGDPHYIQATISLGKITGYAVMRTTSGGNVAIDNSIATPAGVSVTGPSLIWLFDFDGSLITPSTTSSIQVTGAKYSWTITVYQPTGAVTVSKVKL